MKRTDNRVLSINQPDESGRKYEVYVKGSRQYRVLLPLEGNLQGEEHCTCPAFHKWQYGISISRNQSYYRYGYNNPWESLSPGNSRDQLIVSCLSQFYNYNSHYTGNSTGTKVSIGELLELAKDRTLYLKLDKKPAEMTRFHELPFQLLIHIGRNGEPAVENDNALRIECKL